MAFTIPNKAAAGDPTQAEVFQASIDGLVGGFNRTGVATGCAVAQRGAGANMSVDVAAGTVLVVGTAVAVTAVNVAVTTADATNPRLDLVVANASGTVSVLAGTAAAAPVEPALATTTYAVLAQVFVPAAATSITTARITDRRVLLTLPVGAGPWRYTAGQYYGPPGLDPSFHNQVMPLGQLLLYPIPVSTSAVLTSLTIRANSAVASSALRGGFYADDGTGFPASTLLYDAGTFDCSATGNKAKTGLSVALPNAVGQVWLAMVGQGAAPDVYAGAPSPNFSGLWRGANPNFGPASGFISAAAAVSGALPTTLPSLTYNDNTIGFVPRVLMGF